MFRRIFKNLHLYAVVGGLAAITDLTTYTLLAKGYHIDPLFANLVSRPMGGLVSFTLNKFWTFRDQGKTARTRVQFVRYWTVWGINFALSELLIWFFHDRLSFGPIPTKLCAEGSVALFSYLSMKYWTFR